MTAGFLNDHQKLWQKKMNNSSVDETLRALIAPQTVALIGASNDEHKLTARPLMFMQHHGFSGKIYPVNPVREQVLGLKAYPSVSEIPVQIDHAYILLNSEPAMVAFKDCAEAGVKVVSMLADGFAESGDEGVKRQKQLTKLADDYGVLLIGPNSTGVVDTRSGFTCTTNAAFRADNLGKGRFAVLSQSGSLIGTLLSRGQARGIDFSTFISVGNEANADIGKIGEILLADPKIDGFLLFMETIRSRSALSSFARRASEMGKPIVAYMIGKSEEGQALSVSHTGAMTGANEAIDAFLKHIGIRRVENFETLLEAPLALHHARMNRNRPKSVTVVSTTGGGGAMVVDQISARGVAISGCSDAARKILTSDNIPLGHGKLVDVTLAGTKYETMKKVVSTLMQDPKTGLLVVAIGSSAQFNPELAVKPIIDAVKEASDDTAPVIAFPLPHAVESMAMLENGGVPTFRSVESCAETVALLLNDQGPQEIIEDALSQNITMLIDDTGSGVMDEVQAGDIFSELCASRPDFLLLAPDEAVPDILPFSYPVVAKLVSADLPHKTDAGAIKVGISDRNKLGIAITEMQSNAKAFAPDYKLSKILIQEMCSGLGEAIIGVTRDPVAGYVVTVGMGGVLTEIYRDTSVRVAPVSLENAREMIAEVKGFEILRGFRGKPKGDLEALAKTISAVSLIATNERVEEAEINPVLIRREGVVLLDALIRLR